MIYIAFEKFDGGREAEHKAGICARDRLFSLFGITDEPKKTESGKPYIDNERYFFSISHSGSVAACALRCKEENYDLPEDIFTIFEDGEGEIGFDIQIIPKPEDLHKMNKIAVRFICTQFYSVEDFARKWTRSEAHGKLHDVALAEVFRADEDGHTFISGEVEFDEERYAFSICY